MIRTTIDIDLSRKEVIQTEHLIFRCLDREDIPQLMELTRDPKLIENAIMRVDFTEESFGEFLDSLPKTPTPAVTMFGMFMKDDPTELYGMISYTLISLQEAPRMSLWIRERHRRRRMFSEVVPALLDFAFLVGVGPHVVAPRANLYPLDALGALDRVIERCRQRLAGRGLRGSIEFGGQCDAHRVLLYVGRGGGLQRQLGRMRAGVLGLLYLLLRRLLRQRRLRCRQGQRGAARGRDTVQRKHGMGVHHGKPVGGREGGRDIRRGPA